MIGVDFGNDQRHVGRHAIGTGVGDDGATGVGEVGLHFAGDGGIERGKDDFRRAFGRGRGDGHAGDALREWRIEAPFGGFAVGLSARAVASGKPGDLEPGVVLKQLDEPLADHSGRAQDSDWKFGLTGHKHSSVQEERLHDCQNRPGLGWEILDRQCLGDGAWERAGMGRVTKKGLEIRGSDCGCRCGRRKLRIACRRRRPRSCAWEPMRRGAVRRTLPG